MNATEHPCKVASNETNDECLQIGQVDEDGVLTITGLQISDVDPNTDFRQVSISVGYGWLELDDDTGVTLQEYVSLSFLA